MHLAIRTIRINLADAGHVPGGERHGATTEVTPGWVRGRKAAGARWHAARCSRSAALAAVKVREAEGLRRFGIRETTRHPVAWLACFRGSQGGTTGN